MTVDRLLLDTERPEGIPEALHGIADEYRRCGNALMERLADTMEAAAMSAEAHVVWAKHLAVRAA